MTLQSLNRYKAFLLHLGISALVAATVVALVAWLWYPAPYFVAMGGATLLRLLIGVDVVVGPLITLLIFDPQKPSLRSDLAIVAALQVAALAYGSYIMFEARPVFTVFVDDHFQTVPANAIDAASLAKAPAEFQTLPLNGPRIVAARLPTNEQEKVDIAVGTAMGGADVPELPHLFFPYEKAMAHVAVAARPLVTLAQGGRDASDKVSAFVAANGGGRNLGYLPVRARNQDFAMVVDRTTGAIVGHLDIVP